jgi:enoyl-CoA hydratase/carnithine racemase
MARMTDPVTVAEADDWVTLTLDRPSKANALTGEMFVAIGDAVADLDPADVDGVTIRGAGEHFSAGVDMTGVPEWGEMEPLAVRDQLEPIHDALRQIEAADLPVVAALEGYVLGGGLELAISCDVRIASSNAEFGLPESEMGLAMDLGGPQKLPGFVGEGLTKYLVLTSETIGAERAFDAGLVEELHDADDFEAALADLEATLAAKPTDVLGLGKRQVHAARDGTVEDGMQQAIHHAIACYQEEETQRRVGEFLDG